MQYIANTSVVTPPGLDPARPDGYRTPLEKGRVFANGTEQAGRVYDGFARFGGGWVTLTDAMGAALVLHAPDGSDIGFVPGTTIAATSPDGRRALTCCPVIATGPEPGDVRRWLGRERMGSSDAGAGFLRNPASSPGSGTDRWDAVFGYRNVVYRGHGDGTYEILPGNLWWAVGTSVAADYVYGYSRGRDRDVSSVFDARTGRPLLRAPGRCILSADPTGRILIAASDCFEDPDDLLVATISGKVIARLARPGPGGSWSAPVWEDRRHFLLVASQFRTRPSSRPTSVRLVIRVSLVRGRSGQLVATIERAAGDPEGNSTENYILPTR